jgi:hypothetical protein
MSMNMWGIKRGVALVLVLCLGVGLLGCGGGGGDPGTCILCDDSNNSAAAGLPSQINFSLSQTSLNIEGYNVDGIPNEYSVIASDRRGNPVPTGTRIYFTSEGGQVQATKSIELVDGKSRAIFNFLSSEPRPDDGRITIVAYALGEESFEDLNGNNTYDLGEPFQDLGNVFKDRLFNAVYDPNDDEFLLSNLSSSAACVPPPNTRLALGYTIPSMPNTCDGVWSGAGKVYVRRAVETVLSTSSARPLWRTLGAGNAGLDASSCPNSSRVNLLAPDPNSGEIVRQSFVSMRDGQIWYTDGQASGTLSFYVADQNGVRRNPMAAGTTVEASTTSTGLRVTLDAGSPVPSTNEASTASLSFTLETGTSSGLITVKFTSPRGTTSSVAFSVNNGNRTNSCLP